MMASLKVKFHVNSRFIIVIFILYIFSQKKNLNIFPLLSGIHRLNLVYFFRKITIFVESLELKWKENNKKEISLGVFFEML